MDFHFQMPFCFIPTPRSLNLASKIGLSLSVCRGMAARDDTYRMLPQCHQQETGTGEARIIPGIGLRDTSFQCSRDFMTLGIDPSTHDLLTVKALTIQYVALHACLLHTGLSTYQR